MDVDAEGKPVKPIETGIACEKCGRPMVIKKSWRGRSSVARVTRAAAGRRRYPEEFKEVQGQAAAAGPKKPELKVDLTESCPNCGAAMKIRQGKGGNWFLGCSKYPKCRTTAEVSPELLDKIQQAARRQNMVAAPAVSSASPAATPSAPPSSSANAAAFRPSPT